MADFLKSWSLTQGLEERSKRTDSAQRSWSGDRLRPPSPGNLSKLQNFSVPRFPHLQTRARRSSQNLRPNCSVCGILLTAARFELADGLSTAHRSHVTNVFPRSARELRVSEASEGVCVARHVWAPPGHTWERHPSEAGGGHQCPRRAIRSAGGTVSLPKIPNARLEHADLHNNNEASPSSPLP